jgi:hypothetical protein
VEAEGEGWNLEHLFKIERIFQRVLILGIEDRPGCDGIKLMEGRFEVWGSCKDCLRGVKLM